MDTSKFRVPVPSKLGASVVLFMIFGGVIFEYLGNAASELLPTPLSCGSPELLQEFQDRFARSLSSGRARIKADIAKRLKDPGAKDPSLGSINPVEADKGMLKLWDDASLNITSTETIGTQGNLLSCEMHYNYGHGGLDQEFDFILGRDDQGRLTWQTRLGDFAPYDVPRWLNY